MMSWHHYDVVGPSDVVCTDTSTSMPIRLIVPFSLIVNSCDRFSQELDLFLASNLIKCKNIDIYEVSKKHRPNGLVVTFWALVGNFFNESVPLLIGTICFAHFVEKMIPTCMLRIVMVANFSRRCFERIMTPLTTMPKCSWSENRDKLQFSQVADNIYHWSKQISC